MIRTRIGTLSCPYSTRDEPSARGLANPAASPFAELGLTGVELAAAGLIGEEDLIELTESTDPDTTTLVVLLENTWARQIAAAVGDADAVVRSVTRFPAEVVNEVAALAGDD